MEHRQYDLCRRPFLFGVDVHRDSPAIVEDGHGSVAVQDYPYFCAIASQCLIDRIIDDLKDHVMQSCPIIRIPDVHTGALADGVQATQNLNVCRIVGHGVPDTVSKSEDPAGDTGTGTGGIDGVVPWSELANPGLAVQKPLFHVKHLYLPSL
jgi:hypothetical protein